MKQQKSKKELLEEKRRKEFYQIIERNFVDAHSLLAALQLLKAEREKGYEEGVKDGEGTKNGVKRYLMGFKNGEADFKEKLRKEVKAMIDFYGFGAHAHFIKSDCGQCAKVEELTRILALLADNQPDQK